MTAWRFTRSAQEDHIDIWLYTQETWGEAQAKPVQWIDRVRSHRCRHHYLFFVEQDSAAIIVSLLHERMNLVERLRGRL